jgi:hypothetical protein
LVFAPKQPIQLLAIVSGGFICAVMVMPPNGRASVAIIGVMKEFFELRAGALKFTSLNGSRQRFDICQNMPVSST